METTKTPENKYVLLTKKIVLENLNRNEFSIFLFGSRVAKTERFSSDIDIGIWGNRPLTLSEKSAILDLINESIVPYKIELVDFSKVTSTFKAQALKNIELWNQGQISVLN